MEEIMEIEQLKSRGQITIPISIRKQLGLKVKDELFFQTNGNNLIIKN